MDMPCIETRLGIRDPLTDTPVELLPKVAIIGRPNVGKSALFNRICGSNTAIIYDYPGVTRDRLYMRADWGTTEFVVVDTGGLMNTSQRLPASLSAKDVRGLGDTNLPEAIEAQAAAGVEEADAVVLTVDGQMGMVPADADIAAWLRRTYPDKPLMLVVNKCESSRSGEMQAADFWTLGLEPMPVSAISGSGTGDMMDALVKLLPPPRQPLAASGEGSKAREPIAVAILGRPNVGKSSLLNSLVGQERAIVSSVAGTTRDATDTDFTSPSGGKFRLLDTAGIRRKGAVASSPDGAEALSVQRAIRAVRRCEVVALVLDGVRCIEDRGHRFIVPTQDFHLAELVAAEGRGAVIVVNKWDAVAKDTHTMAEYQKELLAQLRPLSWAPVVFTSATSGQRVTNILQAVETAAEQYRRRISTATLNMVIREAVAWRPPPALKGNKRRGRIYYGTQAGAQPPTFVMFVNDVKLFEDDYKRYLEKQLRENAGFQGSPIRIVFRGKPKGKANYDASD
ncbi:hypothetical protein WJX73_002761 [Symbiochloris irregularis]|uniref:GTPase Der n=1 Tax=Symbiochloris irregularis TaxID=706552 RepID=A0AAW1P2P6_9CHLO